MPNLREAKHHTLFEERSKEVTAAIATVIAALGLALAGSGPADASPEPIPTPPETKAGIVTPQYIRTGSFFSMPTEGKPTFDPIPTPRSTKR